MGRFSWNLVKKDVEEGIKLLPTKQWMEDRMWKEVYFFVRNRITKGKIVRVWCSMYWTPWCEVEYEIKKILNEEMKEYVTKCNVTRIWSDRHLIADTPQEVCELLMKHSNIDNVVLMTKSIEKYIPDEETKKGNTPDAIQTLSLEQSFRHILEKYNLTRVIPVSEMIVLYTQAYIVNSILYDKNQ